MPQQRTCLQLRRSGFGLNDLLGGAALGADRPANTTTRSPVTSRNSNNCEDRRLTRKRQGDMRPEMAPQ